MIRIRKRDVLLAGAIFYKFSPRFRSQANAAAKVGVRMLLERR